LQIKEEAARRKALREAKHKMSEAILNASKTKSPEEIAAEVAKEAERQKEAELAALRQKEEDEKSARAGKLKLVFMKVTVFNHQNKYLLNKTNNTFNVLQYAIILSFSRIMNSNIKLHCLFFSIKLIACRNSTNSFVNCVICYVIQQGKQL
jgi:hypothetical protein